MLLPSACLLGVTLAGAFLVSCVLLASPLTGPWALRKRTVERKSFPDLSANATSVYESTLVEFAGKWDGRMKHRLDHVSEKRKQLI